MSDPIKNLAYTELTGLPYTTGSTSLTVLDASKLPDADTEGSYEVVIYNKRKHPGQAFNDGEAEICLVTADDEGTDTLTVTRAQGGTSAIAFGSSIDWAVMQGVTKRLFEQHVPVSGIKLSEDEFTATDGQTTFNTTYTVGYIHVFVNGAKLDADEFTATNGTSVVLDTAAEVDDVVTVIEYQEATASTTGTEITFTQQKIWNSPGSAGTGNITDDLTDARIGMVQKIYHNDSTEPTVPAGWVKLTGSQDYVTDSLNIIFAEWVSGTRVEYWINLEA